MTPPNSPTRFPTFRWLCSWRFVRALLFLIVCLATILALFYTEENVRGKHAWNTYVREQAAKGEKLSLTDFIPPPVPDDQNLALCPLLKPLLDFRFITEGKTTHVAGGGQRWNDTNGLNRLQRLNRTQSVTAYREQLPYKQRRPLKELPKEGTLTNGWIDLIGWQAYFRAGTNLDSTGPTNSAANDVLLALRHLEPDLAELQKEATRRPLDRWPVFYDTNGPWSILLPHLSRGKSIASLFQLRSAARLAARDTEGGMADIELGFRMAESFRDEPFVISQLVRMACHGILLQPLKEGLARHQFSDAQLANLQQKLGNIDLLAAYQHSMRAERGLHSDWSRYAKAGNKFDFPGDGDTRLLAYGHLAPSGWIYQNQLSLSRLYDQFSLPAVDARARRVYPEVAEGAPKAEKETSPFSLLMSPFSLFPKLFFPDILSLVRKFGRSQTQLDQALIACALERYRLAQGTYPDTLAALAPRFLERIPNDLLSGEPHKYRRTDDGQYLLPSIGWKEKDDRPRIAKPGGYNLEMADWDWRLPGKL